MSFMGLDSWDKVTSPGGKLTVLACHTTKKVNLYIYKHGFYDIKSCTISLIGSVSVTIKGKNNLAWFNPLSTEYEEHVLFVSSQIYY